MLVFTKKHIYKVFIAFTALFWLAAIYTIQFYTDLSVDRVVEEEKQDLRREAALVRSKIESAIYEDVYIADSLASILMINADAVINNWHMIASQLIKKSSHIRNIGIAPNNIISHLYPIEGNEAAIGLDFRTVPEQYAGVMHAKETGGIYLDGPIELVQGGQALIARHPIFIDYPQNQNYWGSSSVTLYYQDVIDESGLLELKDANTALQRTTLSGETITFYGDSSIFENPDVLLPIYLPNNKWLLAAKSHTHHSARANQEQSVAYLFGFSGALILYISILILFRAYNLAHQASIKDELTHLYNRRYFFSQLKYRIKWSKRKGGFTLLNIDLNDFKKVNDVLGHEAGDKLLKHIARTLNHSLKDNGFVARVGGDEFLVLVDQEYTDDKAQEMAQTFKKKIESKTLEWKDYSITPSISIGHAIFDPNAPVTEEELLQQADSRMYKQKAKHRLNTNALAS